MCICLIEDSTVLEYPYHRLYKTNDALISKVTKSIHYWYTVCS